MKMIKKILLLTCLSLGMSAMAAELSPEQALSRALSGKGAQRIASTRTPKLVHTANTVSGAPAAYVFSNLNSEGFIILSADDIAYPVLGYSDTGSFDPENMPPQMKWWLSQYAKQIEIGRTEGATRADEASTVYDPSWEPIKPMVQTLWDQDAPYSQMTPTVGNKHCPTGCVATSMAQVMNYFKYPDVGQGSVLYELGLTGKMVTMNFSKEPFDWDHMLNSYKGNYTQEQADAVAYLMKACGYAVRMEYGADVSGAMSNYVASALSEFFKYDEGARYVSRVYYGPVEWNKLIYDELVAGSPIIYDGTSPFEGGHSFVCDGYDGNGFFHINWGWSGLSNGYFTLEALNPAAQGTGGWTGGFNTDQDVVIGIRKPTGNTYQTYANLYQYGYSIAYIRDGVINFGAEGDNPQYNGWGNKTSQTAIVRFGMQLNNLSDLEAEPQIIEGTFNGMPTIKIEPAYIQPYSTLRHPAFDLPENLADGTYQAVLMTQDTQVEDAPWQQVLVKNGYSNFVYLIVENGEVTVQDVKPAMLEVENIEFTTPLYFSKNAMMKVTVANNSDFDLAEPFMPLLMRNNQVWFVGGCEMIAVKAHQTAEIEFVNKFSLGTYGKNISSPTEFTLAVMDPDLENLTVLNNITATMEPTPGVSNFKLVNFEILDAPTQEFDIPAAGGIKDVYLVDDRNDIKVDLAFDVQSGYLDNYVIINLMKRSTPTSVSMSDLGNVFNQIAFLPVGSQWHQEAALDCDAVNDGDYYYLQAKVASGNTFKTLGTIIFKLSEASVGSVLGENPNDVEYYSLQGIRVLNPVKGQILIKKTADKTEKIVF